MTLYEWDQVEIVLEPGRPEPLPLGRRAGRATCSCTATTAASAWSRPRSRSSSSTAGARGIALHDRNFSVRYQSNIPRQVGLAGSSAIIVATLRCLMEFYGVEIPQRRAAVAGPVGRDRGAGHRRRAAGPRDPGLRGAGLHGLRPRADGERSTGCRAASTSRSIPALLPPLYVAYNDRRERADRGVPQQPPRAVQAAASRRWSRRWPRLADLTVEAREALLARDAERLGRLIDANFDLRRSICRLAGRAGARWSSVPAQAGATATFAGSGGAIVGTYPDEATFRRLQDELGMIHCKVMRPQIC